MWRRSLRALASRRVAALACGHEAPMGTAGLTLGRVAGGWSSLPSLSSAAAAFPAAHRQLHASAAAAIIRHFSRPKPKLTLAPAVDPNARKVNETITAATLRLVLDDGTHQVLPRAAALALARSSGKDLLQVDPHGDPPVCRLVHIDKVLSADRAKEKAAKRKEVERRHVDVTKDVRVTLRIASHDLGTKASQAAKWLWDGHRARVCVVFKHARETAEPGSKGAAEAVVGQVIEAINEELRALQRQGSIAEAAMTLARPEAPPKLEALTMSCRLLPLDSAKVQKAIAAAAATAASSQGKATGKAARASETEATVLVLTGAEAVGMARTAAAGVGHGGGGADPASTNTDA
jgi:translation initiation factor IF-3